MLKRLLKRLLVVVLLPVALAACKSGAKEKPAVRGSYNLENPDKFNMPESLFEISGITFDQGNADTVYAVQDEEGKVFRLGWDVPKQLHTKFSKKGDYEDIAILQGRIFVLKSNGTLYTFPKSDMAFEEPEQVQEIKHLLPEGEYEGMYADEASGQLYMICKKCVDDDTKSSVTGYILKPAADPAGADGENAEVTINVAGTFKVPVAPIKALHGKVERGFRPSGLARNPVTGDWYLISAVNKLLVVADSEWNAKQVFPLNGNTFIQPEGIAFDQSGNLYISNEGDDLFSGNILKFKK